MASFTILSKLSLLSVINTLCPSQVRLNNTEELEARVPALEESMVEVEEDITALTNDMDNVESVNILQKQTMNILEADLLDNDEDIEGLYICYISTGET